MAGAPPTIPSRRKVAPLGHLSSGRNILRSQVTTANGGVKIRAKFIGPCPEWPLVGIMHRSHGLSLPADASAGQGVQRDIVRQAADEPATRTRCPESTGTLRAARPDSPILRLQPEPAVGRPVTQHPTCLPRVPVRELHRIELTKPQIPTDGIGVVATVPRTEPLRKLRDPQPPASLADHRARLATPPAIPCFRKEPPGHLSPGRNILRSQVNTANGGVKARAKIFWAVARGAPRRTHAPQSLPFPDR